jgi:hypothetical protein
MLFWDKLPQGQATAAPRPVLKKGAQGARLLRKPHGLGLTAGSAAA